MFKKARVLVLTGIFTIAMAVSSMAIDGVKAGVVNVSSLNLRQGANTQSEVLKKLSQDTDLTVFSQEGNFFKVSASGKIGYVSKEYVDIKDVWNVSNGGSIKVTTSVLNLRSKPSLDSSVVTKMSEGDTASIIGINNSWIKVNFNGKTGYVSPDYVTYVESAKVKTPVKTSDSSAQSVAPVAHTSDASKGQQVVDIAKQYLGVKYVYGGASPSGFDCSGLTSYVYKKMGVSLNRSSSAQTSNGFKISKSELALGDLVFFTYHGGRSVGHVGIYVGNGKFIHAVKPGAAVEIDTMTSGYYADNYWGSRRIFS